MKFKKTATLLLAAVTAFSTMSSMSVVKAAEFQKMEEKQVEVTENTRKELEEIAKDYVNRFIACTYLYEETDLKHSTAAAYYEDLMRGNEEKRGNDSLTQKDELELAKKTSGNMKKVEDAARFIRYMREQQRIERRDFESRVDVLDSEMDGNRYVVHLYSNISFRYSDAEEDTYCGDAYTVTFEQLGGKWYISDTDSEELNMSGFLEDSFNLEAEIQAFDRARKLEIEAEVPASERMAQNDEMLPTAASLDRIIAYNKNNAVAYAYTYTAKNSTNGNNTGYMNPLFPDYSSLGGNCQNFVSQCIWAGFGGNNDASFFTTQNVSQIPMPMDNVGVNRWDADQWYCIKGNGIGKTCSWAHTEYFHTYVTESNKNYTNDGKNMRCDEYVIAAYGDFSKIGASNLTGAEMQVYGSGGDFSHAIIATNATGTNAKEIYYCGNSPMRQNAKLSDYNAHKIRVIVPKYFTVKNSCKHQYTTSSTGTPCECTRCGANKLTLTGTMLKPCEKLSTRTIEAKTNVKCYRIAIGITDPSGKVTWKEFMSTDKAAWSYNFKKPGVYKIWLAARDIDPKEAHSCCATHVFTVRVYGDAD